MIPDIKTILYASDLGDGSKKAFYMAAKEAFKHKAHMVFLNVVEPVGTSTTTLLEGYLNPAVLAEIRSEGFGNLQALMENRISEFCLQELSEREPLPYYPVARVEEGPAAEIIIQVADELDADLIVMGTRSRTHSVLGRFFVGSTAQSVMQLSSRPVMIVPIEN
ncbi:universal stress protein [uncultured Amphritea sp.]|uniref:universal stress protein n=1 Tax=uncultured Amphritea sp. TaxID=981605 RepID=UPI00262E8220|nr:universal stress protein [uncultured Amphritea sp.]